MQNSSELYYQSLVFVPQASKIHTAYITKIKEKKAADLVQPIIRTPTPTTHTCIRPTAENYKHPCFETPPIPIYSTNEA